jgi:UPF0755 protein
MPKLSRERIAVILTGLLFISMAAIIVGFGLFFIKPAEKGGTDQIVTVREGVSLKEVAGSLEGKGIITNKTVFMLWTRLMGYSRQIKAGEYRLSSAMAPIRIMEILTRGMVISYPVTIPEGFSIEQIGKLLDENELAHKTVFLLAAHDPGILEKYGISGPSLEGYLYPDTYYFSKGLSAISIIDTMVNRFFEVLEGHRQRIVESGMAIREIVTLASIIEKETGIAEERPVIASVFFNRMEKKMRLASDPTVIYGIGDFSGNLTKKDLSRYTPYNTYVIAGLPPGPISNPGLESIKAVLYPAETEYLYFVSKNNGSHHFSKTLEEHKRAVGIYQKKNEQFTPIY